MWQPEPGWQPLRAGSGTLSAGVWLAHADGARWVVKRIHAPGPDDAAELHRADHPGYWRRELEFALRPPATRGLVPPEVRRVDQDETGYAVWTRWIEPADVPGPFAARALGRLAGTDPAASPWWSRRLLRRRADRTAQRGGWSALARTGAAALADEVWGRLTGLLERYDAMDQRPAHGDPVPANLLAPRDADLLAVDWSSFGLAPAGADLGYLALSHREDFPVLLEAYLTGMVESGMRPDRDAVAFAARLMAVFSVLARADWALSRAMRGTGEPTLALRHPAVATHLRAVRRQLPQVEALLATG